MKQWQVLVRKEMLEMWRSFKWLWLPVVFVIMGAMQPLATYYMPQLIDALGGLPEGTVIEIPTPTGNQMMAELVGEYGTLGVLVLVLAGMGLIAGEKLNRYLSLVMVRPVPHGSFITAKWASYVTLGLSSLVAGVLVGWYYTEMLIGQVDVLQLVGGTLIYALWLVFVMTVTLLMSTLMKGSAAVASSSILLIVAITLVTSILDRFMTWSPAKLTSHALLVIAEGTTGDSFWLSVAASVVLIVVMLLVCIRIFKRQELAD